jgi:CheY-like chemotaxis protein
LLAEDNKVNQLVARILLERMGCQVDIVENGVAACRAVQRGSYDLVLMDCQMPTMSGFEATQRIRSFEKSGKRIPIIALTAGVLKDEREHCYTCGMDDFVPKPISAKELERALERWLTTLSNAS